MDWCFDDALRHTQNATLDEWTCEQGCRVKGVATQTRECLFTNNKYLLMSLTGMHATGEKIPYIFYDYNPDAESFYGQLIFFYCENADDDQRFQE
jgi:hypothetical protein